MAKKAESTLVNMLLALTVIALVAAAALAALNGVTKKPIEKAKQDKVNNAIADVLKQVDENGVILAQIEYDTAMMKHDTIRLGEPDEKGNYKDSVVCHMAYTAEGEYAGAAVEAIDFNGFGGNLKVMVGFDKDCNVYGYSIIETHETPGLGAKADTWFQRNGKGNIIGKSPATELKVTKDKGEVDAISGSTITSRAFLRSVNKAYENLKPLVGAPAACADSTEAEVVINEQ